ncbi:hypothetical protein LshimejAT787_0100980 [Lyophyllum shimeji]|uniref:DUF6697 domain-containing protein n=1 Tax=Lyophyllum shimeji TaxID=47721 RepID=A0A9P3PD21_LYOSH|nr:hypothetical protein LshimejAT787_0100980 [Lyophyllum shimeji]
MDIETVVAKISDGSPIRDNREKYFEASSHHTVMGTHAEADHRRVLPSTEQYLRAQSLFYDWFEHDDDGGGGSDHLALAIRTSTPSVKPEPDALWNNPQATGRSEPPESPTNSGNEKRKSSPEALLQNAAFYRQETAAEASTSSPLSSRVRPLNIPSEESRSEVSHVAPNSRSLGVSASDHLKPRKSRRTFFDAVEITTPTWLTSRYLPVKKEEDGLRERDFFHPKYEIKRNKEDENAGLGSILRRVDALNLQPFPLDLNADLLDFTVSRDFITDTYGGNTQDTFPKIGEKGRGAHHNYRNFMFMNALYNPYAPQRAGFPGLFYRSRITDLPKVHRAFIRIKAGMWLYLGQYELVRSQPLTRAEWATSSKQTKETWSEHISKKKWGAEVRARITLRRQLRREPTVEELEQAIGHGVGNGVTSDDVRRALDDGEEVIKVWVMRCVAYDETFQQEMKVKFANWKPKPKEKSEATLKNRKTKPQAKGATGRQPNNRKRKRQPSVTPELVDDGFLEQVTSPNTESEVTGVEVDASSRPARARRPPKRFSVE